VYFIKTNEKIVKNEYMLKARATIIPDTPSIYTRGHNHFNQPLENCSFAMIWRQGENGSRDAN